MRFVIQTFRPRRRTRRGFTLIEAALTTVVIGVGVVAMLELLAAGTASNVDGTNLTTGMNLGRNIREYTLRQTFDELEDLDGDVYTTPIDGAGQAIVGISGWQQAISVKPANPDWLASEVYADDTPDAYRITVTVSRNGERVCDVSWIRFAPTP